MFVNLRDNLYNFIAKSRCVSLGHIYMMFRAYPQKTINYHLTGLINESKIRQDPETKLIAIRSEFNKYKSTTAMLQCLWLVAYYGEEKITDFYIGMDYPNQLTFIDSEGEVYQLTYVDAYNLQTIKTLHIPKKYYDSFLGGDEWDESDQITYIAVTLNESIVSSLANAGFDYYVLLEKQLDENGRPTEILANLEIKDWEDE